MSANIGVRGQKTYILRRRASLQVRLDRLVLLVELCQIRYDILDNIGVWKWVDLGLFLRVRWNSACPTKFVSHPLTPPFLAFPPQDPLN